MGKSPAKKASCHPRHTESPHGGPCRSCLAGRKCVFGPAGGGPACSYCRALPLGSSGQRQLEEAGGWVAAGDGRRAHGCCKAPQASAAGAPEPRYSLPKVGGKWNFVGGWNFRGHSEAVEVSSTAAAHFSLLSRLFRARSIQPPPCTVKRN